MEDQLRYRSFLSWDVDAFCNFPIQNPRSVSELGICASTPEVRDCYRLRYDTSTIHSPQPEFLLPALAEGHSNCE